MPVLLPAFAALALGIALSPRLDPEACRAVLPLAGLCALGSRRCRLPAVLLVGAVLRHSAPVPPEIDLSGVSRVVGAVRSQPVRTGPGIRFDVEAETVDGRSVYGAARLSSFIDNEQLAALFEELKLGSGDRIDVLVRLRRPVRYRNPGVFDFRRHLEREGIFWTGTIRSPRLITVLSRGNPWPDRIRKWVRSRMTGAFAKGSLAAGIVQAMVLGDRSQLEPATERLFQVTGLYHLLVVSGFNLAVVAVAVSSLARRAGLRRTGTLILTTMAALGFAALTDGGVPVVRAGLVVALAVAVRWWDRDRNPLNILCLAGLVILATDPDSLEDPSFQMTFAAVSSVLALGMPAAHLVVGHIRSGLTRLADSRRDGWLSPEAADWRLRQRLYCERTGRPLWTVTIPWRVALVTVEALLIAVAVECVMFYFSVESFHRLPVLSPLLNVPAGILAAAITPLGLMLLALPRDAAMLAGAALTYLVEALLRVADFGVLIPAGILRVPSPTPELWVAYAAAVTALLVSLRRQQRTAVSISLVAVVLVQGLVVQGNWSPAPRDQLTVLDVGQGDSILVESRQGFRVLVDGGGVSGGGLLSPDAEPRFSIGEDVVSPFLFSRRIRRLDAVALTHAHHDHLDGLRAVIRNFEVGEIWLGRNPGIPALRRFLEEVQERRVPMRHLCRGDRPEWAYEVLHPPCDWRTRATVRNDDSLVLLVRVGSRSALLTGDLESAIPAPAYVDVLKVPHHGSRNGRLRPASAVRLISVGSGNPFGHPHPWALPGLRTDLMGAINVVVNPDGSMTIRGHASTQD